MHDSPLALFITVSAFLFGAIVGSFLNVCIHRWPAGGSVNNPKRSYCPACDYSIPFSDNVPLLSWLLLRGQCRNCGKPIHWRYFAVELLTAIVFALIIWFSPWQEALALMFFASLCIVATVVDLEHFIIPDEVTIWAVPFGLAISALVPSLHGEMTWLQGLFAAAKGAVAGYVLLWLVVQIGKMLFGRKRFDYPQDSRWELVENEGEIELRMGDALYVWSEVFSRPSDKVIIDCKDIRVDGRLYEGVVMMELAWDRVVLHWAEAGEQRIIALADIERIEGKASALIIPREAMGFGDVKFMAMAGCFVGWTGVLFVLAIGSILGTFGALVGTLFGRREWSARIPFGPYLVAASWLWLTVGPAVLDRYFAIINFGSRY